jgi:imidazolonepropionase-like amidohydrolase
MTARSFLPRLTALGAALFLLNAAEAQQSGVQAYTNFRLFDGTGAAVVENAVLVVEGGRITAVGAAGTVSVPADAESIDLGGGFVMPGLVNAHGHVAEDTEHKLDVYAQYGVTTVFSLGGENATHIALRDAQNPAAPGTARLHVAGPIQEGLQTPEEAVQGVADVAALGGEWVKARLMGDRAMKEPVYHALIEAAHARNLKVAAHMYTLAEAKGLLQSGLDVLAHSVRDQEVDAEFLQLMRQNETCQIPTLTREVSTYAYATTPDFFEDPFFLRGASAEDIAALSTDQAHTRYAANLERGKADLAMAQRNLKTIADAGLRVALGTDSGAFPDRFVGYFEHMELQLMVEAGLTPAQALLAATGVAADCMDLEGVGTLTAGNWADFLVLGADPLEDIANTKNLVSVFIAGQSFEKQ